nr:DNA replication/repair protein RecF [Nanchangia anserum]
MRNVALDDFRSWRSVVVQLRPGVCVLLGRNGQGKTNFVEALSYLSTLHSHRVSADTALVRFPTPDEREAQHRPAAAVIRVKVIEGGHERLVDLEIVSGKANRARLGRTQVRPREILGQVRTVLFAPEDLDIVRGDPSGRRRFLDDLAIQREPVLAGVRAEHERVLHQRAALLKRAATVTRRGGIADVSTLDIWDEQLAGLAARLIRARHRLVVDLAPHAGVAYTTISEHGRTLELAYQASLSRWEPDVDLADVEAVTAALRRAYAAVRDDEVRRGVNLVGAHRDDLETCLDAMPVRGFASHGETWSVALALRLAQFEILRADGGAPILILDDVFAELDAARRRALLDVIAEADQVLITAAVDDDVPDELEATIYRVAYGDDGTSCMVREGDDTDASAVP